MTYPADSRPSVAAATGEEPAEASHSSVSDDTEEEERPQHTSEIGTLKKLVNEGGTAWLGSSSGVYFVNTVRRAFASAFAESASGNSILPASEDILTGEDDEGRNYNGPVSDRPSATDHDFRRLLSQALGSPPTDRSVAMELVSTFFRSWHPIFPFLHGPTFLQDVDRIYLSSEDTGLNGTNGLGRGPSTHTINQSTEIRKRIIFQLIINIASLDRSDIQLPVESRIKSTADVTRIAGYISLTHDIETIQALIAASLYLIATIAIRQACTIAGMIVKLIYHAGLHRCPLRYADLSAEHCEIRKRIFWSAYIVDRHLSLSLGIPNTFQDSDIDVCLSGKELHRARLSQPLSSPTPANKSEDLGISPPRGDERRTPMEGRQTREKHAREAALTAYAEYSRLTGRIIELFHKSIHARFPKQESIIYLTSDIENWWNDLPSVFTGEDVNASDHPDEAAYSLFYERHRHLAPFFTILYQQLLLLLNRPRLSLDQSTAEFQHGLSVCIKASRHTLDIVRCQSILESMNLRWFTVKNCHKALSLLLANIQSKNLPLHGNIRGTVRSSDQATENRPEEVPNPRKRPRMVPDERSSHPTLKRSDSALAAAPNTTDRQAAVPPLPGSLANQAGGTTSPQNQPQRSGFINQMALGDRAFDTTQTLNLDYLPFNSLIPDNAGSASYINLQDMASASAQQPNNYNMFLQPESIGADGRGAEAPMFWPNIGLYGGWDAMTNSMGNINSDPGGLEFSSTRGGEEHYGQVQP
ncbi:putative fungal specific transcription [Phaeomoniella chlamydospora]|uniref:Putative fungal specific transcription n=1 Tax=Phaeomoniella chlamydospora TaxID=158046 RepID=A0A0G2EQG8_PHACM|nr:putative fungal specific transcription [Phaeomoniella chlamydospora]